MSSVWPEVKGKKSRIEIGKVNESDYAGLCKTRERFGFYSSAKGGHPIGCF